MLATRGIPQLYAGEEILMTGGHDPDNRKDFPGGWPGDARSAFTKEGRTADEQEMFEWTKEWLKLRQKSGSIKYGRTLDLSYDEDVYVFAREYKCGVSVVAFNRSATAKKVSIPFSSLKIDTKACLVPLFDENFRPETICSGPDKNRFELMLPARSANAFTLLQESAPLDCGKN